jgi:predicted Zn-ribbon and HTH transcriptional regulator
MDDTVIVATYNEKEKAEPLKNRLVQAGIRAEVHVEAFMERLWYVGKPIAAVHLRVHRPDYEKACVLLDEWDKADGALRDAIRCPECHSSRVEYPQLTRRSVMPNLFGGLAAALHIIPREYYCRTCHFTWPREGQKRSPTRPHMAPYYFIEGIPQTQPQETKAGTNH